MSNRSILLQHLFGQSDIGGIKQEQITGLIAQYPYFAHARWFKALKSNDPNADLPLAAVFATRPLRLIQFLNSASSDQENTPLEKTTHQENEPHNASRENTQPGQSHSPAPLIQPLYTSDYFAYTGDKLPDHIEDDKRPTMEQLHSFTGWLRTLKKNRGATTDPDIQTDEASLAARAENEDADVRKNAEESVTAPEEVFTEAMAEVRAGKGQIDKAIAIYEKLSLSNPEKSAYFAQKIADLKNN